MHRCKAVLDLGDGTTMVIPMGSLANVVLEEHEPTAQAAVARALERVRAQEHREDLERNVSAWSYDVREVARQPIKAGCWVTLGEVTYADLTILIDVNVRTGETREVIVVAPARQM